MKRLLLVLLFTIWPFFFLRAQNTHPVQYVQDELASMFEFIDTTRVSTGYLKDRAFELVDLSLYNGLLMTDDNLAGVEPFISGIVTVNNSIIKSSASEYDIESIMTSLQDSTAIAIKALLVKYNYIAENAITDTLIVYQNGKVYDCHRQNPYNEAYAFIPTLSQLVYNDESVLFKFPSGFIFGNTPASQIEIDFDNGNGFESVVGINQKAVSYTTAGIKDIKIRVSIPSGARLVSHVPLEIVEPQTTQSGANNITPDNQATVYYSVNNQTVSAVVSYKYASSHLGALYRPLIYVEGFDFPFTHLFDELDEIEGVYQQLLELYRRCTDYIENGSSAYGQSNFSSFYQKIQNTPIITDNYDIIYVDFRCPDANIKYNAELLRAIITDINSNKQTSPSGVRFDNIIIGHSMGGLVARVALRKMEQDNVSHETGHYISYDSPHLGVNVPIGAQYAVYDVKRIVGHLQNKRSKPLFDALLYIVDSWLRSPSATQMMYYSITNTGNPTQEPHNEWQAYLDTLGFPKGDRRGSIENLAIVNGGSFTPSTPLLSIDITLGNNLAESLLMTLLTRFSNINMSFLVKGDSGAGGIVARSQASYKKEYLWRPDETFNLYDVFHYSPSGTFGYDYVPSSTLLRQGIRTPGEGNWYHIVYNPIAFVPSASAFCIPGYENYDKDFHTYPPTPFENTPFSSYLHPNVNAIQHDEFHTDFWTWVYNQTNMTIVGPAGYVQTGDSFSVSKEGSNYYAEEWTTSDSNVAVFSGDTLIVYHPGPVRLTYHCEQLDTTSLHYYKHTEVFAGIPSILLGKTYTGNNTYRMSISCSDASISDAFEEALDNGVFSVVWGYKVGSNSIVWLEGSSSMSYDYQITENVDISIFVKLKTNRNTYGETSFVMINKGNDQYFNHDPQAAYVGLRFNISYDCQYTFLSEDGLVIPRFNKLILWRNTSINSTFVPDAIRIDGQSLPVSNTVQAYLNGTPVTLYMFDILQSTAVQHAISVIRAHINSPFQYAGDLIQVDVMCDNESQQYFIFPVVLDSI